MVVAVVVVVVVLVVADVTAAAFFPNFVCLNVVGCFRGFVCLVLF